MIITQKRINMRALDARRKRKGYARVDVGGGAGRYGSSRKQVLNRLGKTDLLRPSTESA